MDEKSKHIVEQAHLLLHSAMLLRHCRFFADVAECSVNDDRPLDTSSETADFVCNRLLHSTTLSIGELLQWFVFPRSARAPNHVQGHSYMVSSTTAMRKDMLPLKASLQAA